jgi:hypothetical protein
MSELRGNLREKMIPTPSARLNSPAVKAMIYLSLPGKKKKYTKEIRNGRVAE